jgi:hypothetical protein
MGTGITFQNNDLSIDMTESSDVVSLVWIGKSIEREPVTFIAPILVEALKRSGNEKRLVMDFEKLDYMNSSTITPILRILNEIKLSAQSIRILYSKAKRWQDLSFSALKVLQTRDGRIEITGK